MFPTFNERQKIYHAAELEKIKSLISSASLLITINKTHSEVIDAKIILYSARDLLTQALDEIDRQIDT